MRIALSGFVHVRPATVELACATWECSGLAADGLPGLPWLAVPWWALCPLCPLRTIVALTVSLLASALFLLHARHRRVHAAVSSHPREQAACKLDFDEEFFVPVPLPLLLSAGGAEEAVERVVVLYVVLVDDCYR